MDELRFGTDGWRDIIADRYTIANLGRATQGYADHLLAEGGGRVVVGYDTRFGGETFALAVAAVLSANGIEAAVSDGPLPTPALSFAVTHFGAAGGVMLTASHNPPSYGGFKLKGSYGGSATDALYRDVARRVATVAPASVRRDASADVPRFDVRGAYYARLDALVDMDALQRLEGSVLHDAMGGSAGGWLSAFVRSRGLPLRVAELHAEPHPLFYGVNPEPIPANLSQAIGLMRSDGHHFAVANDGDGDRLAVVLPGGEYFNSHQIFAVLLDLLSGTRGTGRVVKTFTVSRIVERLAARRGLPVDETPVGFKYITDAMLRGDVLVGGEESGGIGVAGHLPERDGIANALLLLESVAIHGEGLAQRFAALERETTWRHAYDRRDLHLSDDGLKERVLGELDDPPGAFAGRSVGTVERRDGVKLNLGDDAWLLFRASGTEPVLRIYCEAPDPSDVDAVLDDAERWVRALA